MINNCSLKTSLLPASLPDYTSGLFFVQRGDEELCCLSDYVIESDKSPFFISGGYLWLRSS